jgi:hypothetical protein
LTTRRIPARRSWSADPARLAGGLAVPVLAIAALGGRAGLVPAEAILPVLAIGFLLGAVGLALGIHALTDIWRSGADGARAAISGIIYAAPVIVLLALVATAAIAYPRLTDISTDVENPPVLESFPEAPDRPDAAAAALQKEAYPELTTRTYGLPIAEVYIAARSLFEERGWAVTHSVEPVLPAPAPAPAAPAPALDEELLRVLAEKRVVTQSRAEAAPPSVAGAPGQTADAAAEAQSNIASLEATAKTLVFGFEDAVAVRLQRTPEGTRVDMRSASRRGEHDLGQNARRIRAFLKGLDTKLQPPPDPAAVR